MRKISLIIALLLTTALAGCASSVQQPAPNNDKQALLHAIEGTKLTNLMRRLHNLSFETKLTEPEKDYQRRQATLLVLTVAEGTENILDRILVVKPELNLAVDQQKIVHSLTDNLRNEG